MSQSKSQTIEEVLFERMGISVSDAVATGTDFVDESMARAADSGIEVDARLSGLGQLFNKLTEPSTLAALSQLLEALPDLVRLAELSRQLPNVLAAVADVIDDFQPHCAANQIDVDKAITNGLQAVLYLGSQIEEEHLCRIGELLASDIVSERALNVVNKAAKSLNSAREQMAGGSQDRVGMFGMLKALRDPQVQRSLAFAVQFGKAFGKNFDEQA